MEYYDKVPSNGGRPKSILNSNGIELTERLAGKGCSEETIAGVIGLSVDTLHNSENNSAFSDAMSKGKANCKADIYAKQYEVAMSGNATMLIWLGRQHLGQREQIDTNVNTNNESIEVMKQYLSGCKNENK